MSRKLIPVVLCVCSFILLHSCTSTKKIIKEEPVTVLPEVLKEFRAAWIATVANINWPSKPGLSTETQKQEAIYLLDFLQRSEERRVGKECVP